MKYVYPNNLMARRSEKREIIKGCIIFAVFMILIAGLFLSSEYSRSHAATKSMIVCNGTDVSSCHLE